MSRRRSCAAGSVLESGAELCSGERAGVSCRDPASETKVSAGNGRARDLASDSREGQRKMMRQMQRQEKRPGRLQLAVEDVSPGSHLPPPTGSAREDICWLWEDVSPLAECRTKKRGTPGRHTSLRPSVGTGCTDCTGCAGCPAVSLPGKDFQPQSQGKLTSRLSDRAAVPGQKLPATLQIVRQFQENIQPHSRSSASPGKNIQMSFRLLGLNRPIRPTRLTVLLRSRSQMLIPVPCR